MTMSTYDPAYYQRNKKKIAQWKQNWRRRHREQRNEYERKNWHKRMSNPEKRAAHNAKNREYRRKRNAILRKKPKKPFVKRTVSEIRQMAVDMWSRRRLG